MEGNVYITDPVEYRRVLPGGPLVTSRVYSEDRLSSLELLPTHTHTHGVHNGLPVQTQPVSDFMEPLGERTFGDAPTSF